MYGILHHIWLGYTPLYIPEQYCTRTINSLSDKVRLFTVIFLNSTVHVKSSQSDIVRLYTVIYLNSTVQCTQGRRVTHKEWDCKDDLELLKFDQPIFKLNLLSINSLSNNKTSLQLQRIQNIRKQTLWIPYSHHHSLILCG